MRSLFLLLHRSFLIASTLILFSSINAFAAETVILKYRILRESVSVKELTNFAQTGKLSSSLKVNFALARQDPKAVRQYLTQPVKINPLLLDRVLNSQIGNLLLDQISQTIHTPSRLADRQALRSALVLSAIRDREITLIEIIQNYPTSELQVEGDRLENAYNQLYRLQKILEKPSKL